jgi:hypothetical protein
LRRLRPSPAAAIASLALFVSLGGTTYAVTALPRNSVGTRQLRDRAVTEGELANRAVISSKLATGAVVPRTIARQSITGSRIAPDALGGAEIDESLLRSVPLAQDAERAKLATRALSADAAERARTADTAASARHAVSADGLARVDHNVEQVVVPPEDIELPDIPCDGGDVAVGGGFWQTSPYSSLVSIFHSAPFDDGTGWRLLLINGGDEPVTGNAYAICVMGDRS